MLNAVITVAAPVLITALIFVVPGALALAASGWSKYLPRSMWPAVTVLLTLLLASIALILTLSFQGSIKVFAALLTAFSVALLAFYKWRIAQLSPDEKRARFRAKRLGRQRGLFALTWLELWAVLLPMLLIAGITVIDSPNVRSDTWWHLALINKLAGVSELSSASIAFETGAPGNANYPLPTMHALLALATLAPRVTSFTASWFVTVWLAPVAMLAYGAAAAKLIGRPELKTAGYWVFFGVMTLGYGPWFFTTRFLHYPGHVAGFILLPIMLYTFAAALGEGDARRGKGLLAFGAQDRAKQVTLFTLSALATLGIGILHGNYVLYPVLFVVGAAAALTLAQTAALRAWVGAALITITSFAVLALQLPWLRADRNFLRGSDAPVNEPSAFMRHANVFTGSEESFHLMLGSMAAQPLLVLGALLLPAVLWFGRRRPGPWLLAGGAVAIAAVAVSPPLIRLLDAAGSVTPITRFDRVYPAAIGVLALAFATAWSIEWIVARRPSGETKPVRLTLVALAGVTFMGGAWWFDSIRETALDTSRRYVEARWVGGLSFDGWPKIAVASSTIAIIGVCVFFAYQAIKEGRACRPQSHDADNPNEPKLVGSSQPTIWMTYTLMLALTLGLAPASIERVKERWRPEAYGLTGLSNQAQGLRQAEKINQLDTYPPRVLAALRKLDQEAVVLASFSDIRPIAARGVFYSINESTLRGIKDNPPKNEREARALLTKLVDENGAKYVASAPRAPGFRSLLKVAEQNPQHYQRVIKDRRLVIYRVKSAPDAT